MSEPASANGNTRPAICKCGTSTDEFELQGLYGSRWWMLVKHNGPCGMGCMAAGVHYKAYDKGEYHSTTVPCAHCEKGRVT